jgi:nucleoside-diphosphate-sugar epimerase
MGRLIAVTGATGFIGRHVAAALLARGDRVRAIVRPDSPRAAPPGVEVWSVPLTTSALETAFAVCDTVVHLAGLVAAQRDSEYVAVNVDATRAVALAARAANARLVHVSSLAAAGPAGESRPRSEDDPPRPITMYGITKLAGERAVTDTPGLRWTVLRPGVVYGSGDRALVPLVRLAALPLIPLVGRAEGAYMFVHIDDLTRAILAAIDAEQDGLVCFVGHARPVRPRELYDELRTVVGGRGRIVRIPAALVWIVANAGELAGLIVRRTMVLDRRRYNELYSEGFVCRVDRLRERLAVEATIGLHEGMKRSAEWYGRAVHGSKNVTVD